MNDSRFEESRTLEILESIEQRSDVTQRHLATEMGVALGLANSYLKRCVRKGLVKIQHAPANRYLYYLTPKGLTEKSRLTAQYLAHSLSFYRRASESCSVALQGCVERGYNRVGLFGASDLAEVAALQAIEQRVRILCLCDPGGGRVQFLNRPVVRSPKEIPDVPIWLITGLDDPELQYETLSAEVGEERVVVPSILGFRPGRTSA